MRFDRHDRLSKAFKKLRTFQKEFWKQEASKYPSYCLDIKPAAPGYQLRCYNHGNAIWCRSVGAYVHWIALQVLLKINYDDAEKGFFVGNVLGFPEITLIGDQPKKPRLVMPFTVSITYQKHPEEWLRKLIDTSWILGCDEVDLENPTWFDVRENVSEFEIEGSWERATNWSMQTQDKASKLFKNRDQLIAPHWLKFIDEDEAILSKPKCISVEKAYVASASDHYPFRPKEKEKLGESLIKIEDFINTTESLHYQRLAKRWQFCLIKALFRDTKLTLRQETIILGYFGIHHPTYSEVEFKALTLELSAYPIDYQRTVKYLDALLAEFLTDEVKYKRSGELLLIILICLQSACRKSRIFSCQDVLDLTSDDWCPRERAFKICGGLLPVSRGLSKVIEVFIPKATKQKRKIFDLSRSWINKHIRKINTILGYDWENDAVSLQTFIFRPPHEWIGHRSQPILWNLASRVRRYQYYNLFPFPGKPTTSPQKIVTLKHTLNKNDASCISQLKFSLSFLENLPPRKKSFKAFILRILK